MSLSKQVTRARHAMFARHSNPWSAWTRWASAPLVLVPVWTRRRSDAALVAVWFALNPVIFPKPANLTCHGTLTQVDPDTGEPFTFDFVVEVHAQRV